jgi:hypothetical protein
MGYLNTRVRMMRMARIPAARIPTRLNSDAT